MTPREVVTRGARLHVVTEGPEDGPMVLLLHGFPETSAGWRRQMPALAEAGWFCVAPDQRGYGRSDKPARTRAYRIGALVDDALAVIDAMGRRRCHVVGHDWGGMVAWWLALDHPERVASFSALNIPHPWVFSRWLFTSRQLLRSWYIFAMQLPWLPERSLSQDDHDPLVRVMFANSTAKPFTPEEVASWKEAWSRPGALSGMLAWYRAMARWPTFPRARRVSVPTRIVFGKQDLALDWRMAEDSAALCDDVQLTLIEEAGHFVQHDAPDRVNRILLDFLGTHREATGTGRGDGVS